MKHLLASAATLAILGGVAAAAPAEAATYRHHARQLTPYERVVIARNQAHLNALTWRVRADGRVTARERAQLRIAQARHNALVYRLRHN